MYINLISILENRDIAFDRLIYLEKMSKEIISDV